jgi:hypothetical protein
VAQGVGPEFKPQHCKQTNKTKTTTKKENKIIAGHVGTYL